MFSCVFGAGLSESPYFKSQFKYSSGFLSGEQVVFIERIYQYIWEDKRNLGTLSHTHTHLRRQGRKYRKRGSSKDSRTQENIYNYKNYIFKMNYQPFDAFSLSLKTSFEKIFSTTQYVTQIDFNSIKRYVLGTIDHLN